MSKNRTLDGRPLNMGVSGFGHYSTDRIDPGTDQEILLTPQDLLIKIREIRNYLNDKKYSDTLKTIEEHIQNLDNPHQMSLDKFVQDIGDVLYEEYVDRGGTAEKSLFFNSLFQVLRVVTQEELRDKNLVLPDNVLLSVAGARSFLTAHETDRNAHQELLDQIFVGTPTQDPIFGIMGYFGVSQKFLESYQLDISVSPLRSSSQEEYRVPYSYVNQGGYIEYCESIRDLPVDYTYREGMLPCFGRRTNYITSSQVFTAINEEELDVPSSQTKYVHRNLKNILPDAETAPDKSITASAIFSYYDIEPKDHSLVVKDVGLPNGVPRTFSIYAKSDSCRYLALRYKDYSSSLTTIDSPIYVAGIYDLKKGTCLTINPLNRYRAEIVRLANGWCRCCLSMYSEYGQESDMEITFFKGDNTEDFTFQANSELLGYLWGMQYEEGNNASPYIPTEGTYRYRDGIRIIVPTQNMLTDRPGLAGSALNTWSFTMDAEYLSPVNLFDDEASIRPVVCFYEKVEDRNISEFVGHAATTIEIRSAKTTDITTYSRIRVGSVYAHMATAQLVFPAVNDQYTQLVFGIDNNNILYKVGANDAIIMENTADANEWIKPWYMFIGCDKFGNFLEGYMKSVILYSYCVSADEANFLTGEKIHG